MSTQEENSTLHFVDAHGQWYNALINPNVTKHEYNWQFLQNDGQNISYVGDARYTIRKGVDVSKYQGDIDWNAVREDGYEFAIIRILIMFSYISRQDAEKPLIERIIEAVSPSAKAISISFLFFIVTKSTFLLCLVELLTK